MNIVFQKEVLNYLKEKNIKEIFIHQEGPKGSKWCPIMPEVQVELLKNSISIENKLVVEQDNLKIYIDSVLQKIPGFYIYKVIKIPFFPMIIGIEKISWTKSQNVLNKYRFSFYNSYFY